MCVLSITSLFIATCLLQACKGMYNRYAANIILVPIKEMTDVLTVESKAVDLARDSWVRMKTGTYKGDLAMVVNYSALHVTLSKFDVPF